MPVDEGGTQGVIAPGGIAVAEDEIDLIPDAKGDIRGPIRLARGDLGEGGVITTRAALTLIGSRRVSIRT